MINWPAKLSYDGINDIANRAYVKGANAMLEDCKKAAESSISENTKLGANQLYYDQGYEHGVKCANAQREEAKEKELIPLDEFEVMNFMNKYGGFTKEIVAKLICLTFGATKDKGLSELDFGDYVEIEQKRHGSPNEMYTYKVIGRLKSNSYVYVPVQSPAKELVQTSITEEVVACVCCGVFEKEILNFRVKDVRAIKAKMEGE